MAIESHGWDHNHASLASTATSAPRGGFDVRDSREAEAEVARAAQVLRRLRGRDGEVLFAYPYGDAGAYLADEWLPAYGDSHGVTAAFGASSGEPAHPGVSRWRIPRYVFGHHWQSHADLGAILRQAGIAARATPAVTSPSAKPSAPGNWRERLRTWEVDDAKVVAGELFRRSFGHEVPDFPRHFVLVLSPEPGSGEPPSVVAYVHQTHRGEYALCGGMCVDERAYRRMPKWLFAQVHEQGGLATIVTRDSVEMLGDCSAIFGHVGEPRARAADLRTGFVDTGREHLMVIWRRDLSDAGKRRLIDEAVAIGPF